MFARKLTMRLKDNGARAFQQKIEAEVIPLLRKHQGFLDEMTFLYPNGKDVHAFSLWDTAENAEAYSRAAFPEISKILATVTEGTVRVQTYEVLNSTFHKIAAAVSA